MGTGPRWKTALILLGAAATAAADGTIDTTGATITPGSLPTQGALQVDACAPPTAPPTVAGLPELGPAGVMTGGLPQFGDAGNGMDGVFSLLTSTTLPGGTYNFSSYHIGSNAIVTYSGAVVLLVTDSVTIDGTLQTTASGAPITIRSGGSVTLGVTGHVDARQDQSPVIIDAGTNFTALAMVQDQDCSVLSQSGALIRAHGIQPGTGNIDLGALLVSAGSGNGEILAAGALTSTGGRFQCGDADLRLQAFGGDLDVDDFDMNIGSGNGITVEAWGTATFSGDSFLNTFSGSIRVAAFGGDLTFRDQSGTNTRTGDTEFDSALSVVFADDAGANTRDGDITLTAFGGDVHLVPPGLTGDVHLNTLNGDLTLQAGRDVSLNDNACMNTSAGDHVVHALGGGVTFGGAGSLSMNQSSGRMEIRARDSVGGAIANLNASSLLVTAGTAGITLGSGTGTIQTFGGTLGLIARGAVTLSGEFISQGDLTVVSHDGNVDVSGATLRTPDGAADAGGIAIASYAGGGTIDATNATITGGTGTASVGDISLTIHSSTAIQPRSVSLILPGTRKAPRLKATGFIDTGPSGGSPEGPATLQVGTHVIDLDLRSVRGGRRFEHRDDTVRFRLLPQRSGASRARFTLAVNEDLTFFTDPDAPLDIQLVTAGFKGRGNVLLSGGRFRLGKAPGSLLRPDAFLEKLVVRLKGDGRDSFRMIAGYAAPHPQPTQAPPVTIELGPNIAATIAGDQFRTKGSKFVFKGDVNGITNVTLDPRRGRLVVKGKNVTFGAGAEGPTSLRAVVGVAAVQSTLHVRAVRTRKVLKY